MPGRNCVMFQSPSRVRAYRSVMDRKGLAAAFVGAHALDPRVRRHRQALGGDLPGAIYDPDRRCKARHVQGQR